VRSPGEPVGVHGLVVGQAGLVGVEEELVVVDGHIVTLLAGQRGGLGEVVVPVPPSYQVISDA